MQTVSSDEILKILYKDGWMVKNKNGSHLHLIHGHKKGKVTVPHPRKDMNQNTYHSILKQAGLK
ncbi:MAG: type II toxin-antitoxin system HicA family toxin [Patescibacteria group bacterium]|nr:type II toxin-antitoxin system HicA family toxin [Patescibacteria group bacterium]